MRTCAIEKNREYSNKFIQPINNPVTPNFMKEILQNNNVNSMIDLGCGDGIIIHAIKKEFPKIKITGVDISERRINGLKQKFPSDNFYIKDVCDTKLKEKFDFIHSSQVIEHVKYDSKMVEEISRLLKKNGILFCSSVIKKPLAIYRYRNNGKFVLDPTHEKEYKNQNEFLNLFKRNFKLIKFWITPVIRKKFEVSIPIPGYKHIYGIWRLR